MLLKWKKSLCAFFCLTLFLSSDAVASCGTATCPLDASHTLETGKWKFGIDLESIDQSAVYVGDKGSSVGAITGHHDEILTVNKRLILSSEVALTDFLTVAAELPFVNRRHTHIHNHHGTPILEQWNFTGVGDLFLNTYWTVAKDKMPSSNGKFGLSVGVKFPTGVRRLSSASGEAEVPLQPGSGSYDTSFGVYTQQRLFTYKTAWDTYAELPLTLSAAYTFHGNGTDGWRNGNKWVLSAGTSYLLAPNASLVLQCNGLIVNTADKGNTGEDTSNTGGEWFYLSPGVSVGLGEGYTLNTLFQVPIYRRVNGIQLTSDLNLRIGVSQIF
jgi:hypothetical protein